MANSTSARKKSKPAKPHPDFALYSHRNGQWAKKVRGKTHFFGTWDDPQAALEEWIRVKDDLLAGRTPSSGDELTLADICDDFLIHRQAKVDAGKMKPRTWDDYKKCIDLVLLVMGEDMKAEQIKPKDFDKLRKAIERGRRPKTVHNLMSRFLAVINFANKNELTETPIRTGTYFERPSVEELAEDRDQQEHHGEMDMTAEQIRDVLAIACPQMKAMILLGVNCGFGNADCGRLECGHLDLEGGWVQMRRGKKGRVFRKAKLWPETIKAIQQVILDRKEPQDEALAERIFITKYGMSWHKEGSSTNPISQAFRKLTKKTGSHVKGVNFYALRRTFATVGAEAGDAASVDMVMGHKNHSMSDHYRQRYPDKPLNKVAKHVRKWLFGKRGAK